MQRLLVNVSSYLRRRAVKALPAGISGECWRFKLQHQQYSGMRCAGAYALPWNGICNSATEITPAFQTAQSGLAVAGAWLDYSLKVQLADLNGDGIPDLVAYVAECWRGWNTHTALGKGDGAFHPARLGLAVAGAWADYTPQLADANGDGISISAAYVASRRAAGIPIPALGKGDGTFQAAQLD